VSDHDNTTEEKEVIYLDKVGLVPSSTEKIDIWISAVEEKKQGTKITKRALVNWIIEQLPGQPSKSDINLLVEKFYDEERHLKQRIRALRERKLIRNNADSDKPPHDNEGAQDSIQAHSTQPQSISDN
jgi:hypothetical protein